MYKFGIKFNFLRRPLNSSDIPGFSKCKVGIIDISEILKIKNEGEISVASF